MVRTTTLAWSGLLIGGSHCSQARRRMMAVTYGPAMGSTLRSFLGAMDSTAFTSLTLTVNIPFGLRRLRRLHQRGGLSGDAVSPALVAD